MHNNSQIDQIKFKQETGNKRRITLNKCKYEGVTCEHVYIQQFGSRNGARVAHDANKTLCILAKIFI